MTRRRRSREMGPEERLAGLAVVTVFMLIGWFLWLPKTNPLFEVSVLALLAFVWWQTIKEFQTVHRIYETREQLAALTPDQFEQWCANRLRALGYTVRHVGGQGDHGIDLFAEKDQERVVVQCKRFTGKRTVGEPHLRDVFGAMHSERAARAIVITAGYFTAEARDWAKGKPIELWDIDRIVKLRPAAASAPAVNMPQTAIAQVAEADVRCGQCGSELLVRRNRSTGEAFYGCARYPRCRFTRPIKAQSSGAS